MTDTPKRVRMFAGPNGSGKTSLVRNLAKEFSAQGLFHVHHFINADDIFRDLQGPGVSLECLKGEVTVEEVRAILVAGGRLPASHPFLHSVRIQGARLCAPADHADAYAAAAVADFFREELLLADRSFSFETVMSHQSKVDFLARARMAGYRTYLYFVATESSHLNVYRIRNRVAIGGHDVPEAKIVERYERCLQLLPEALQRAYRAFLFDNSGSEPVWLAQLTPERTLQLEVADELLPAWFRRHVDF
jgi:predicted ABC-type ATPase